MPKQTRTAAPKQMVVISLQRSFNGELEGVEFRHGRAYPEKLTKATIEKLVTDWHCTVEEA